MNRSLVFAGVASLVATKDFDAFVTLFETGC